MGTRQAKNGDKTKTRAYFRKQFTVEERKNDPIELTNAPIFLESLYLVSTEEMIVGPPDER